MTLLKYGMINTHPMNPRERYLRTMRFEPVDRIPLMEMGVLDDTFERWQNEGLPGWVGSLPDLETQSASRVFSASRAS